MRKLLNISYGAIQGSYWMYYAAIISFSSVFLLSKNYTNSEIGVILAAANILAVLLQPILANAADMSKKAILTDITGIISIGLLVATVSLYLFTTKTHILSIIFIMLGAWLISLQPLINSMAFHLSESGHLINFGITRSFGSVAFAVLCAILGVLVKTYGIMVIPATGIATLTLFFLSLLIASKLFNRAIKFKQTSPSVKGTRCKKTINMKDFVIRNKIFILFASSIVLVFFQHAVINTYLIQIVTAVGGSSSQMGRLYSFMALLELPGLIFFSQLRGKLSCQFMLKIAAIAFVLKAFLTFMATSVLLIYIAFSFQLVSYPIFLAASVHLVDEVMEKGEAVKGQSFISGMMTVSYVLASLSGGFVLDLSGASQLLLISAIFTVIGTLIVVFIVDKIERK